MSVAFVVVPAVMVSWPILCGAVAGAAAALGYTTLKAESELCEYEEEDLQTGVEVSLEGSEVLAESMNRDSEFAITNGDVTARFRRGVDGRCTVHVSGEGRTEVELDAVGREILGQVTQQYAYNKVLSEVKSQGFQVTNEEVTQDRVIRITVSKYV